MGGLSFCSREAVNTGARIDVRIPIIKESVEVTGRVLWCHRKDQWYDVGISFSDHQEDFRTIMVEQICHIDRYKVVVRRDERREISSVEAAAECIKKYADSLPKQNKKNQTTKKKKPKPRPTTKNTTIRRRAVWSCKGR